MLRLSAILAASIFALPAAPSAQIPAGNETASSGAVSATLSWEGGKFAPHHTTLTIVRNGVSAFAREIPDVLCDGCLLSPSGSGDVKVVDLDGDGEPEVVVTGFTGLENCCEIMGVYDFRAASGTYGELVQNWQSSGFRLADLDRDGGAEIVSRDLRFEDLFSSHAASYPPVAVFEYERPGDRPKLTDATERFPALIRENAAFAKRHFERLHRGDADGGGLVAAYVADQYLLGRGAVGLRELDRQIARGILGTPKEARAYRRRLLTLLRRYGYRSGY